MKKNKIEIKVDFCNMFSVLDDDEDENKNETCLDKSYKKCPKPNNNAVVLKGAWGKNKNAPTPNTANTAPVKQKNDMTICVTIAPNKMVTELWGDMMMDEDE